VSIPIALRLALELERDADPIQGVIELPNGQRQSFWGWLELLEELRRATDQRSQAPTPSTQLSTGPPSAPDPVSHCASRTGEENE
jgi:hypothetical protein